MVSGGLFCGGLAAFSHSQYLTEGDVSLCFSSALADQKRPWKKFAILVLVGPRTLDIEQLEARHAADKREGIDRQLRD
jgi:hypothetical protein